MVENIRRIGIFMIAAQTVLHFVAGKQYEKYIKIITGVIILMLFISPFASSSGNPVIDWRAEVERMEQQIQSNMQQEMPYVVNPVEAVALQQIEEEIKVRLNDIVSGRDCSVTDVAIELEEAGGGVGVKTDTGALVFQRVKVTLQGMDTADASDTDDITDINRAIRIEEITVGFESEANMEQHEVQDSNQDARIQEYQQLFAQALGITDERVEVTYSGGW